MTRFRRNGKRCQRIQPHQKFYILSRTHERSGTKGQVHAGAADSGGFAVVLWRDHSLGKVFRTEVANPAHTNQLPGANSSPAPAPRHIPGHAPTPATSKA